MSYDNNQISAPLRACAKCGRPYYMKSLVCALCGPGWRTVQALDLDKNGMYSCAQLVAYIRQYADETYNKHTLTWGALRAFATHLERL